MLKLVAYAEQVFISQLFRNAVFGIHTLNESPPGISFWRFDRAGGLGSITMDFSSSNPGAHPSLVIKCLLSLTHMSP